MFDARPKYVIFDSKMVDLPFRIAVSRSLDVFFSKLSSEVEREYMFYLKEIMFKKAYYPTPKLVFNKTLSENDFEELDVLYVPFQFPIFPKQERSHADVELKEDPPTDISVIGHKHPGNISDFSHTDNEYLLPQSNNILVTSSGIQKFTLRIPTTTYSHSILVIIKFTRDEILWYNDTHEISNNMKELIDKAKKEIDEKTENKETTYEYKYEYPRYSYPFPYRYMQPMGSPDNDSDELSYDDSEFEKLFERAKKKRKHKKDEE